MGAQSMGAHNCGLRSIRSVIIRGGVATELVTAKMEEGATLDAVAMPRSLTVNIFGDGGDAGT